MVIDSSAAVAIFLDEPEREDFLVKIQRDKRRILSAGNLLEMQMILATRASSRGVAMLMDFVRTFSVEVVPFDQVQAMAAGEAFLRFGKGRHKASLNFGDCMAYALAISTGEPLLFKGSDFIHTDVRRA